MDWKPNIDGWDVITSCPTMDCARDGSGWIEGMLHNEYGARNNAIDGTSVPLVDDIGGLTRRPL